MFAKWWVVVGAHSLMGIALSLMCSVARVHVSHAFSTVPVQVLVPSLQHSHLIPPCSSSSSSSRRVLKLASSFSSSPENLDEGSDGSRNRKKSDKQNDNDTSNNDPNSNDDSTSMDAAFMTSLKSRITEMKVQEDTMCPLVDLDCMVPRQVLRIRVNDPQVVKIVRQQLQSETPTFGMRGSMSMKVKVKQNENDRDEGLAEVKLMHGVEVEIVQKPHFTEEGGALLVLKAKRRFEVISEMDNKEKGFIEATVKYLNSKEQEEEEIATNDNDQMCVARATLKAADLTSLINDWIRLAREYEKRPGQIEQLLSDIGNVPPSTEPSERALWVGALINPLPEMGVATGIRPQLLSAATAKERVDIACEGIRRSIAHMDQSNPLW